MNLKEFFKAFLPDYETGEKEFERTNTIDEFDEWLIDNFSTARQNFADRYYKKTVENCIAEIIDIYDLEQPKIDEL
ncbi:MAG: hypothetical protein LBJ63_07000 [Prevotellaceae bacterium]|jgi:hypothetical protein|nr:hypothetical protein [Prevotellaceae bacterium]